MLVYIKGALKNENDIFMLLQNLKYTLCSILKFQVSASVDNFEEYALRPVHDISRVVVTYIFRKTFSVIGSMNAHIKVGV